MLQVTVSAGQSPPASWMGVTVGLRREGPVRTSLRDCAATSRQDLTHGRLMPTRCVEGVGANHSHEMLSLRFGCSPA